MDEHSEYKEAELREYLNVIWKRKWLIIIPTFFLVIATAVISFSLPKVWEVDAIIQPSKFFVQTQTGQYLDVIIVDPKQIAGQINQESYHMLIASELNLDIKKLPEIKAENLKDTKLVRVSLREKDVEKAKSILQILFNILKADLDKKIDVEMKAIETQITMNENEIKKKEIDIQSKEIEKTNIRQQILSAEKKLLISEERFKNISDEMKAVKKRIEELDEQQRKALLEKEEGRDAIGLLLYSNEVQNNLRYYNTLDENLSTEKITQENLKLGIKEKEGDIKQLNAQVEKLKNEIEEIKSQIALLKEKKTRIDYAQMVKEPTSSIFPISPKKRQNVMIAGFIGLMFFTILAFFLEYLKTNKGLNARSGK